MALFEKIKKCKQYVQEFETLYDLLKERKEVDPFLIAVPMLYKHLAGPFDDKVRAFTDPALLKMYPELSEYLSTDEQKEYKELMNESIEKVLGELEKNSEEYDEKYDEKHSVNNNNLEEKL